MPTLGDCTLGNFYLGLEPCGDRADILLAADWGNNDYSDLTDRLTNYRQTITVDRGVDEVTGEVTTGTMQVRLENSTKRFTPPYASSPIYPNVSPPRPIIAKRLDGGGTAVPIFTGTIREIGWQPILTEQFATLECVDLIERLQNIPISTPLYEGYRSDELIAAILVLAGYTGTTNLETGNKTFPYASWRKVSAFQAIQEVVSSEMGLFFISANGVPKFHGRYHRVTTASNDATINNDAATFGGRVSSYDAYNRGIVTVYPRSIGGTAVLWTWDEVPRYMAPGEVVTLEAGYADPVTSSDCEGSGVITPVSGTDYTAHSLSDGGGTALTANLTLAFTAYGQYASYGLTNGGTVGLWVTLAQMRGLPVTKYAPVTLTETDPGFDPVTDYVRAIELDQPLETSTDAGRDAAIFLASIASDAPDKVSMSIKPDAGTARKNILASLDIGDRIALTDTGAGYSAQGFFVNKVHHEITGVGNTHEASYELSRALDVIDFVVLDSLTQAFDDLLGY